MITLYHIILLTIVSVNTEPLAQLGTLLGGERTWAETKNRYRYISKDIFDSHSIKGWKKEQPFWERR